MKFSFHYHVKRHENPDRFPLELFLCKQKQEQLLIICRYNPHHYNQS